MAFDPVDPQSVVSTYAAAVVKEGLIPPDLAERVAHACAARYPRDPAGALAEFVGVLAEQKQDRPDAERIAARLGFKLSDLDTGGKTINDFDVQATARNLAGICYESRNRWRCRGEERPEPRGFDQAKRSLETLRDLGYIKHHCNLAEVARQWGPQGVTDLIQCAKRLELDHFAESLTPTGTPPVQIDYGELHEIERDRRERERKQPDPARDALLASGFYYRF